MTLDGHESNSLAASQRTPSRFSWVPVLVFALFACAIGGTGFFIFTRYQEGVKKEAHDTLGAIADLRVNQVTEWR